MVNSLAQQLATLAERALEMEVSLAPKPGLVDPISRGAHRDMDVQTFKRSIQALAPYFVAYAQAGLEHEGELVTLFQRIRQIGQQAESAMLQATSGVNTHKGANFSLAVLLAATGYYLQTQPKKQDNLYFNDIDTGSVCQIARQMTQHLLTVDFANLQTKATLSYGEKLYLKYRITGIRGEAGNGYPCLTHHLLPLMRQMQPNDDGTTHWLRGLVYLMAISEDGNLLHRGGIAALQQVQRDMQALHEQALPADLFHEALTAYDQQLIDQYLSPGGSADLLGLGLYFAQLEHLPLPSL